jgi:hypothetical protein
MSYLDRLKRKIQKDAPEREATKVTKAPSVPFVASRPEPLQENFTVTADREAFEERAAMMEFDGGLTRAEAERMSALANGPMAQR